MLTRDGAGMRGAVTLAAGAGAVGALALAFLGWWRWGRPAGVSRPAAPSGGGVENAPLSADRVDIELERALERILVEEAERRAAARPGELPTMP